MLKFDSFPEENDYMESINASSDNNYILTGGSNGVVKLWNKEGNLINTYPPHSSVVNSVTFSPDNAMILSGSINEVKLHQSPWIYINEHVYKFTLEDLREYGLQYSDDNIETTEVGYLDNLKE